MKKRNILGSKFHKRDDALKGDLYFKGLWLNQAVHKIPGRLYYIEPNESKHSVDFVHKMMHRFVIQRWSQRPILPIGKEKALFFSLKKGMPFRFHQAGFRHARTILSFETGKSLFDPRVSVNKTSDNGVGKLWSRSRDKGRGGRGTAIGTLGLNTTRRSWVLVAIEGKGIIIKRRAGQQQQQHHFVFGRLPNENLLARQSSADRSRWST